MASAARTGADGRLGTAERRDVSEGGLVAIWALSGVDHFWPIWSILGWGIGLAFHARAVYVRKPISEDDIRAEMQLDRPPNTPE